MFSVDTFTLLCFCIVHRNVNLDFDWIFMLNNIIYTLSKKIKFLKLKNISFFVFRFGKLHSKHHTGMGKLKSEEKFNTESNLIFIYCGCNKVCNE